MQNLKLSECQFLLSAVEWYFSYLNVWLEFGVQKDTLK